MISVRQTARVAFMGVTLVLALSACGGMGYRTLNSTNDGSGTFITGLGTTSDSSSTSSSSGTTTTTGIPPFQTRVGTYGYNSVTVNVTTGHTLKVTFAPGTQDQTAQGTGFTPNYSMLGVYISATGTAQQATPMLSNGYSGGSAQTSPILDFSNQFTTSCSSSDTSCRATVTITIAKPNYDYWCLNYGEYCPWTTVWSTHPWHGTLTVQTDDTDPIE